MHAHSGWAWARLAQTWRDTVVNRRVEPQYIHVHGVERKAYNHDEILVPLLPLALWIARDH